MMTKARVIPVLLLKGKGLVKTVKFKNPVYVGDPVNAIRIFNDKGCDELMLLDITATAEGREPNFRLIEEIASECFMPLGYGGGVRTVEQMGRILHSGVEKICINSAALSDPDLVRKGAERFGAQAIVVSIDVRKKLFGGYEVYGRSGGKGTGKNPIEYARAAVAAGAGEILINAIDRDGTGIGYDLDLVRSVAEAVDVPTIACGGAGGISHMREAVMTGHASAVAAGSMFVFHGKHRAVLISYPSSAEIASISVRPN